MRDVRNSVGLIIRENPAVIGLTGPDATDYLHRMVTCAVKEMSPGSARRTSVLKGDGRMIALARLVRLGADRFLMLTQASRREALLNHLDRFLITEDVQLADHSSNYRVLEIAGPAAPGVTAILTGGPEPEPGQVITPENNAQPAMLVIRTDELIVPTVMVLLPPDQAGQFFTAASEAVQQANGIIVGEAEREVLRIEAGVPVFGAELDESIIPLEAGLHSTISFTKGCFPGQEIVARIDNLGHPANVLVGLQFPSGGDPQPGTPLLSGEKTVGRITSATTSPALGASIALGYVKWDQREPGTLLKAGNSEAVVGALPFF